MFDLISRLLPLIIIGFIGLNGVNSCQPPPMGLYNAYNQYSQQQAQQQPYQPQQYQPPQQNYQPPYDTSSGQFTPQQSFDQNQVLTASIPPPTLVPSFLQDISPEDEVAAFESNSIIPVSTAIPDTFSPPPDPPANPFLGESRPKDGLFEENTSELFQEFSNKCAKNGVQNLGDLMDCIDGVQYSLQPMHAQFGSNKCDFEPEFVCRFYSSPQEKISFKSGQFRIDPKTNNLFERTFSTLIKRPIGIFPERNFVYVDFKDRMHPSAAATLKTDILCQNGDGKLSFDYWTSNENITLKVCTTDENERSCTQDIPYDREAARIEVDVIHPQSGKFSLEIVVSNFTKSSIFIIDNLDFSAKLCEDSAFIPEPSTTVAVLPQSFSPSSVSPPRNQAFGSQINQNFLPLPNQGFQPLNQASYHQNFIPLPTTPSVYGSYVTAPPPPQLSPSFQSLPELPAPVFNNLRIKPSALNPPPPSLQYSHQGFPVENINNNTNEAISPGVAFVQNKYSLAPKLKSLSPAAAAPKPMKLLPRLPIRPMPLVAACDLLHCKFDKTFCRWKVQEYHGRDIRYGRWQLSEKQVGNIHTGIKPKERGGFAYVGMDPTSAKQNNRTIYVLESPEITLSNNTLLSFDLYRRSSAIMLQVCLDSLTNCPYESPKLDSKVYWKEGESILLPQKTKKVYFVATQWKRFKWLAIDNIVLNKGLGCKGREAASSSSATKIEEIRKFFRKQRIENRRS